MIAALRTLYYKLKYQYVLRRATFGKGTVIKCKLQIKGPGRVFIGADCIFDSDPWRDDYVTLFTHRKRANINIGNRVILRATRFGSHLNITVEDDAIIENASIYDSDFHNIDAEKRDENFNEGDRSVIIGRRNYIGCECLCSKGTVLGANVIMLPGSVTGTKNIKAESIIAGNPARLLL